MPRLPWVTAVALVLVVSGTSATGRAQLNPGASPMPAAAAAPRNQPAPLGRAAAVFLVRSVLIALHQANQTGNYTVLRDISAPDFARANTAARLADIFAPQREKQIDLSEVVILDPDLATPELTPQGHLRLSGSVRSSSNQIEFELAFSPVEGRWRLDGIATNVLPLQAAAPARPDPSLRPQAAAAARPDPTLPLQAAAPARPDPRRPPALRTSTSLNPAL